jgi:hypothetical protein
MQTEHQEQQILAVEAAVVDIIHLQEVDKVLLEVLVLSSSKHGELHVMEFKHSHHQDHLPYHQASVQSMFL